MSTSVVRTRSSVFPRAILLAAAVAGGVTPWRTVPSAMASVVPAAQAAVDGNTNNGIPFGCADSSYASMRYQQVYAASEVGTGLITAIRYRLDAVFRGGFGPTTSPGVTITLSSSTAAPDGLSPTFASNVGPDVTTAFSGDLTLVPATCVSSPCPFSVTIPVTTPFFFGALPGTNLLLDVTIPTCKSMSGSLFDAQFTVGDSVSRVFSFTNSTATSGLTDSRGLVTEFVLAPCPCGDDGNPCTDDRCDSTGTCTHPNNTAPCNDGIFCNGPETCSGGACAGHPGDPCPGPDGDGNCAESCDEAAVACTAADPDASSCDDGIFCNGADTCGGGACGVHAGNEGASCDDGNACTLSETCSAGACTSGTATVCPVCEQCVAPTGCAAVPKTSCFGVSVSQKATIQLTDGTPDAKDKVAFTWAKGSAVAFSQLGDPSGTDDYVLCVFDTSGPGTVLLRGVAPAGGTCGGTPCWKQLGSTTAPKGWKYADKDGTPDGLTLVQAAAGSQERSKTTVKGKGDNLQLETFSSLNPTITAQVQATNGSCWTASCSTITKNLNGAFKCKGQ